MKKLLRFELVAIVSASVIVFCCIIIWILSINKVSKLNSDTLVKHDYDYRLIIKSGIDQISEQIENEDYVIENVLKKLPVSTETYVFWYNEERVIYEQNDVVTIREKNKTPQRMFDEWAYKGVANLSGIAKNIEERKSGFDWFQRDGVKLWASWEVFQKNKQVYIVGVVTPEEYIFKSNGTTDFVFFYFLILIILSLLLVSLIVVMGFMYVRHKVKISELSIEQSEKNSKLQLAGKKLDDEQSKIRGISVIDTSTGVYNRSFFDEMINKVDLLQFLPIGLILIDINGMKQFNKMGREVGDKLLKYLAGQLKKLTGRTDIVARVGDDEFAFMMVNTETELVDRKVEEIKLIVSNIRVNGVQLNCSITREIKSNMDLSLFEYFRRTEQVMNMKNLYNPMSEKGVVVTSLMKTLEERTHETQEHCMRMRKYAMIAGKALGLSEFELVKLGLAALLHDIGKIAVADNLLNKEDKYTEKQYEEMKAHPEIGYRIAMTSPELSHIARYLLEHHERWDGKGYPNGLMGEEISVLGRILAIVDSFDAMTSDRVYQKIKTFDEACDELRRCKGTQFDPNLVEVFIQAMSDKNFEEKE